MFVFVNRTIDSVRTITSTVVGVGIIVCARIEVAKKCAKYE
jgi:hypothetical protein